MDLLALYLILMLFFYYILKDALRMSLKKTENQLRLMNNLHIEELKLKGISDDRINEIIQMSKED